MPSAAERMGDFSALLALGPQYQIYNPYTGVASGSTVLRQPFPNNVIPPSLLNPVAQKILSSVPLSLQTGLANGSTNYNVDAREFRHYRERKQDHANGPAAGLVMAQTVLPGIA